MERFMVWVKCSDGHCFEAVGEAPNPLSNLRILEIRVKDNLIQFSGTCPECGGPLRLDLGKKMTPLN